MIRQLFKRWKTHQIQLAGHSVPDVDFIHCSSCDKTTDEWVTIRWQLTLDGETRDGKAIADLCLNCAMPARNLFPTAIMQAVDYGQKIDFPDDEETNQL